MKIVNLTPRTTEGYSFSIQFGPFIVDGFWYSSLHNNITPPCRYSGEKRYRLVRGAGVHFKRLRDLVQAMVVAGRESYNTETDFSLALAAAEAESEVSPECSELAP